MDHVNINPDSMDHNFTQSNDGLPVQDFLSSWDDFSTFPNHPVSYDQFPPQQFEPAAYSFPSDSYNTPYGQPQYQQFPQHQPSQDAHYQSHQTLHQPQNTHHQQHSPAPHQQKPVDVYGMIPQNYGAPQNPSYNQPQFQDHHQFIHYNNMSPSVQQGQPKIQQAPGHQQIPQHQGQQIHQPLQMQHAQSPQPPQHANNHESLNYIQNWDRSYMSNTPTPNQAVLSPPQQTQQPQQQIQRANLVPAPAPSPAPAPAPSPQNGSQQGTPQPAAAFQYPPPSQPPAILPPSARSTTAPPQTKVKAQPAAPLQKAFPVKAPSPAQANPPPILPPITPRPRPESAPINSSQTPMIQAPAPRKRSTSGQSGIRITHPDLLDVTNKPDLTIVPSAPFLVFHIQPEKLNFSGKLPKSLYKAKFDGEPILPQPIIPTIKVKSKTKPRFTNPSIDSTEPVTSGVRIVSGGATVSSSTPSDEETETETESSEPDDSSDDEDYEEVTEQLSDLREATRPKDIPGGARWDAIGATWLPKERRATNEDLGVKIRQFYDLITTLRERLKKVSTELTTAEANKQLAQASVLKDSRAAQRKALHSAFDAAIRYGHRDVLGHLGDNHRLVNGLMSLLIDCNKVEDFSGELPRSIFQLMAHFTTLSDELLKKVKFDTIQKRFAKRGDDIIKKAITTILANTQKDKDSPAGSPREPLKDAGKPAVETAAKVVEKSTSVSQVSAKEAEQPKMTAGTSTLKRSFDGDATNGKPAKKAALAAPAKVSVVKTTTPAPKVTSVQQKSTNFLQSLTRPKTAAPSKPAAPAIAPKKAEPAPSATSSLAAILASIEKPKETPKVVRSPEGPPETPEERKKRERKESRRHLRVKWKDGDDLVQVKLFTHEVAEDEGRDSDMLRDAHDDRSEGMMHKRRMAQMGEDAMDDDDDYDPEIEYRSYPDLMGIDFGLLPAPILEKSYETRGGILPVSSQQQEIQKKREAMELMVVYTDPKDIPFSPREPFVTDDTAEAPAIQLGQPKAPWLVQRLQEIQQHGPDSVLQKALGRSPDGLTQPGPTSGSQPSQVVQPVTAITSLAPKVDLVALSKIEAAVAYLSGKPFPPTEPPQWMTESQKAMWWDGYRRDNPTIGNAVEQVSYQQLQSITPGPGVQNSIEQMLAQAQGLGQAPNFQQIAASLATPGQDPSPDIVMRVQEALAGLNNPSGLSSSFGTTGNSNTTSAMDPGQNWGSGNINYDDSQYNPAPAGPRTSRFNDKLDGNEGRGRPNVSAAANLRNQGLNYDENSWQGRGRGRGAGDDGGAQPFYKKKNGMCRYGSFTNCPRGKKCLFKHERP